MALLALAPRNAMADPALALGLSDDQVRLLDREFHDDLRMLDAFAGKRKKMDGTARSLEERGVWTFYGRLGVLNFQNRFDPHEPRSATRFTLRRTGPRLTGRIYVGIHRAF